MTFVIISCKYIPASFILYLAEHIIEINPLYSAIEDYCKNYVVSDEFSADLTVAVSEKEVLYEQTKSDQENALAGLKPSAFSMPYLETLAVYRKIAEAFPMRDIMLFHGSAIAYETLEADVR